MGHGSDEELWVAACVEAALPGVQVCKHDDGSEPSMYDLDLVRDDVPFGAMEVTAAADPAAVELWNLVNGSDDRWIEDGLEGGWLITVALGTRAKRLKHELPALLRILETSTGVDERRDAEERLRGLGVVAGHRGDTDFPGSVYVTIQQDSERTGGAVSATGDGLVHWFDDWVQEGAQKHNLDKLRAALRPEKHLFVLLPDFTTAPFSASDVLMRPDGPLPQVRPTLPPGVTDVWFMSSWSTGDVFHFGRDLWGRSSKVFEAG